MRRAAVAALLLAASTAAAHPMGNFAICHYARLRAEGDGLQIRFLIDLAEIPTVEEKRRLDRDGDGTVDEEERRLYLAEKAAELIAELSVTANGAPLTLRLESADVRLTRGAAGLDTTIVALEFFAPFPSGKVFDIFYQDRTYVARTGWKEVVAVAGAEAVLKRSSAAAEDRSAELTVYPEDVLPSQDTEARLLVVVDPTATAAAASIAPPSAGPTTPRDAFTEAIAAPELAPPVVALGLAIAFVFGALHALSPGHGKLLLITAFSLGLASVLVALGLLVVRARRWLERFRVSGSLLRRIPVASAATITLIGVALVARALAQMTS